MEFNTLDDVERMIPDEESARKYIANIRWGKFATCPFCGNHKAYFIEKGVRYKCADKLCYKKFSVTTKTLMQASNIPLDKWIKMLFICVKSRGRFMAYELETVGIADKNAWFVKQKIDTAWPYVLREGRTKIEILNDLIKTMCDIYSSVCEQRKSSVKYFGIEWPEGLLDISNPYHYDRMLNFVKCRLYYRRNWLWLDFAAPSDIISETFLWMQEKKIKEYDADSIMKHLSHRMDIMFQRFLITHPKYNELLRRKWSAYKKKRRINITTAYLVSLIRARSTNKLTVGEIKANKELLEKERLRIKAFRKRENEIFDFHSHFD